MNKNLFIDLNQMKAVERMTVSTHNLGINGTKLSEGYFSFLRTNAAEIASWIADLPLNPTDAHRFVIQFEEIEDIDAETFAGLVNGLLTGVFAGLKVNEGRKREHRLDVPDELKCVNCSFGMLKQLVNTKTRCDVFNVEIYYGEYFFILCDDTTVLPKGEFIHD